MSALDNLDVLEYRVSQLEKLLKPLMKLVNDLEKKLALLAQKMVIATMLIGVIVNGVGVWYSANASKSETSNISGQSFSEPDKKAYYETRISDSDKIKAMETELARLKSQQYQASQLK